MAAASKVAVVVGVGPGLGAHAAKKFAAEGYKVALLARKKETLSPVEVDIKAAGNSAVSIICNAGDAGSISEAFGQVRQQLGDPEVLIYNAGPGVGSWPPPGILDLTAERFTEALQTGATGGLLCAQQVLPKMLEAGRGTIIYTGATASLRGGARFAALAAPKFALRALAQCMAREFQPKGIHVAHVIIDGQIDSPRIRGMMPDRPIDTFLSPAAIADAYYGLHTQDKTIWTQELDMRPYGEKF